MPEFYPDLNDDELLALTALINWDAEAASNPDLVHKFDGQTCQNRVYLETNGEEVWSLNKANGVLAGLIKKNRLFVWSNGHVEE